MLHKLFQNTAKVDTLPKSFYEADIPLLLKLDKDITKKRSFRPVTFMNIDKNTHTKLTSQLNLGAKGPRKREY